MKTLLTILLATGLGSFAMAKTPIIGNDQDIVIIKGSKIASTKVSAFAYYIPTKKMTGENLDAAECRFEEDKTAVNGSSKVIVFKTAETESSYAIPVTKTAKRGECAYTLDAVYLSMEDSSSKVTDEFILQSEESQKRINRNLGDLYNPDFETAQLPLTLNMYCEFNNPEGMLCENESGSIGSLYYQMKNSVTDYQINFSAKAE